MAVTQREVARRAGVSPATVSLVLSGRASELSISRECAEKVRATAARLGYRGNYHARALAVGRAMTLGFVNRAQDDYAGHYGLALATGVERRARDLGYDLLVFGPGEQNMPLVHATEGLAEKRVDALVVPHLPGRAITRERSRRWPLVLVESEAGHGYPAVNLAPEPGLKAAVDHLTELGHRKILWLGVRAPEPGWQEQRLSALRRAAALRGIELAECLLGSSALLGGPVEKRIERLLGALRSDLPPLRDVTAVCCCNDVMGLALCATLNERGKRVPADVSVVGFDDLIASFAIPAMTTVSHMLPHLGARAVDLAAEIIEKGIQHPHQAEVTVSAELVVRKSTCRAR